MVANPWLEFGLGVNDFRQVRHEPAPDGVSHEFAVDRPTLRSGQNSGSAVHEDESDNPLRFQRA